MSDDDFEITADRSAKASATLHQAHQYFMACYLGGYTVECCLKLLVKSFNPAVDISHHRLENLLDDYRSTVTRYALRGSKMARQKARLVSNPNLDQRFATILSTWHPRHRYSSSHPWNEELSNSYQAEIGKALAHIARLHTNGVIK